MIGAIIGDIVGSVYEWNNYRAKDFSPFFRPDSFFTDDTVCTVAVSQALQTGRDPGQALKYWGQSYWDNGGWGARFAEWLQSASAEPYGSYGNGAAMRVSSAAWLADSLDEALKFSDRVTSVTHDHPEGMKGASATTSAIYLALRRAKPEEIRTYIQATFGYDLSTSVDTIRKNYTFNESCQGTVPQALTCALNATSFDDAIRNAISIGGDSDTVASIAGPVAEALFGVPPWMINEARLRLPANMRQVLQSQYAARGVLLPMVIHEASWRGWPEIVFAGTRSKRVRRIALAHYLLTISLSSVLGARRGNRSIGSLGDASHRVNLRVRYTLEYGTITALRLSRAGGSGSTWMIDEPICTAAEILDIALQAGQAGVLKPYGFKLARQGQWLAQALAQRQLAIKRTGWNTSW